MSIKKFPDADVQNKNINRAKLLSYFIDFSCTQ